MTDINGQPGGAADPGPVVRGRARIAGAIIRPLAAVGGTLVVYGIVPIRDTTAVAVGVFALIGLIVVCAVFMLQLGRIGRSRYPVISAVESLALVLGMFLSLFAFTYVSMSAGSLGSFTEPLDKVGGVYFSVTVLATVGFGDIAPVSSEARVLVTIQMVMDLVLIGVAVKLLANTAKRVVAERTTSANEPTSVISVMEQRLTSATGNGATDEPRPGNTDQPAGGEGRHGSGEERHE